MNPRRFSTRRTSISRPIPDEAAFAAQKEKMINDVKAMGYEAALAEQQEKFEKAKETVKSFE